MFIQHELASWLEAGDCAWRGKELATLNRKAFAQDGKSLAKANKNDHIKHRALHNVNSCTCISLQISIIFSEIENRFRGWGEENK